MTASPAKLPWFFHPDWFWGVLLAGIPLQLFAFVSKTAFADGVLQTAASLIGAFYLSWAYLLYEYLAPGAPDPSRHWPGRNRLPLFVLLGSMLLGALMTALGYNTNEPNEPGDIVILPIFFSYFLLNWRASDLLVSLERSSGHGGRVFLSFIAMFYLPLSIWWFYGRLKLLRRQGSI